MPEIDRSVGQALDRLRMPSYFVDAPKIIRDGDRADWRMVDSRLIAFAGLLLKRFRSYDIPMFVHGGYRSKDEQEALFRAGRSKTQWPMAAHCQGAAIDVVHGGFAWDLTRAEWAVVGKIGKDVWANFMSRLRKGDRLDIVWGGDWSSPWDPAHWELSGWRARALRPDQMTEFEAMKPVRITPYMAAKQAGRMVP